MRSRLVTACASALLAVGSVHAFDLQGHRGARGLAPENTMAAFRKALAIGVTTLETDVGITRDGKAIVAHDRSLNPALTRGADGKWLAAPGSRLRELDVSQLQSYDVGRLDPASNYAKQFPQQVAVDGERMPTLDELLALARDHGKVRLNIETKLSPLAPADTVDPATFARIVVDAIKAAGLTARTTLQSFDWRTLVEAKKLAPALHTACLTLEGGNSDNVIPDASGRSPWLAGIAPDASLPKMVKAARCDIWSPAWRNVTRERVAEAKALGIAVIPWTVNEPGDMQAMIDAGVDGLITDYPDRARKVMAERGLLLP